MAEDEPKHEAALPTIWRVPDDLWSIIAGVLLELDPPCKSGRQRIDQRQALNGILYRGRTGCQWNQLPREFGDDSSVHRTMQRWERKGVWERVWALLVADCDELGGVSWHWQAVDCSLGKARSGGIWSVRTRPTGANAASSVAC